jgi:hypothetical protein
MALAGRLFSWSMAIAIGAFALVALLASSLRGCATVFAGGDGFESGPGKGTESARLPVEVTPRTGLVDHSVVTVSSGAFMPHEVVGVAVCLAEADTESAGVDACDEVSGARFATSPEGELVATFTVPRVVTIAGRPHDCAAPGAPCILVAASARDYDRSGGQRISYRSDLPPAPMVARTTRPNSDLLPVLPPSFESLVDGAVVEVIASGFQPDEPVLLARCAGFPVDSALWSCEPVDAQAFSAIMGLSVEEVTRRADGTGTARFQFTAVRHPDRFMKDEDSDCAEPDAGCAFVIAAAADTKRSAVAPYVIAP